jgi:hypothetical protein
MAERLLVRLIIDTWVGQAEYPLPQIEGRVVAVKRIRDYADDAGCVTYVEEGLRLCAPPDAPDCATEIPMGATPFAYFRGNKIGVIGKHEGRLIVEVDGRVESVLYA